MRVQARMRPSVFMELAFGEARQVGWWEEGGRSWLAYLWAR